MKDLTTILKQFDIKGTVSEIKPLGNGLINDTYKVTTQEEDAPDYVYSASTTPSSPLLTSCSATSRK